MTKQYVCLDNPGNNRRIVGVAVHKDVYRLGPDTSWIGEYHSDQRDGAIDRKERGDMERGDYRYWSPANTAEETGNQDSVEQDYQRSESLSGGDWCFMGVWCEAEVQLASAVCQHIRSGGLWGIESDSDDDYLDQVECEQLAELREQLFAIGFTQLQIDTAFKQRKVVTA